MVESVCSVKHVAHVGHGACVPVAYVLIEDRRSLEHLIHVGDLAYVPFRDIFVEGRSVVKSVLHVRHRGNVPVPDLPVGCGRVCFVAEPKIERGLEVRVGEGAGACFGKKDNHSSMTIVRVDLD